MPRPPLMLAAIALVAGLLAWLLVEGSPLSRRIDRLNAMVAAGKIYQLNSAEHATLLKTMTWLAQAAGLSQARIGINERYSTGNETAVLHVYVTLPDQVSLTGCPAYNAIYDAELDAIFLDQSFISLSEWKQSLAAPDGEWGLDIPLQVRDVPSINVFLRFVLLHEFGHRQLHRRSIAWYFSEAVARRREEEADAFALEKMKNAFSLAPKFGVDAVEKYTGDLINYPVKADMPVDEQIEASLVEMIKVMLGAQLTLPSASPTFAVGRSHPNVISRLVSLMNTAARTYRNKGLLQVLTQYTQLQAQKVETLAQLRPLEIRSTLPVTALAWGGMTHGLLVRTSANGLYTIPANTLAEASAPGATLQLDQAVASAPPNEVKRLSIWVKPDGSIVAPSPRRSDGHDVRKDWPFPAFTLNNSDIAFDDDRVDLRGMMSVPYPWPYALFHAKVEDRQWLVSIHDDGQARNVELAQLTQTAQKLVGTQKVALDFSEPTFAPDGIFFPLVTAKDQVIRFLGFGFVRAATMELQQVILPKVLDNCVYTTTDNPLVDARFGLCQFSIRIGGSRDRIFQAQLVPQPPADWIGESRSYGERLEVWELASEEQPNLLISQPLALSLAKRGGISDEAMAKVKLNPRLRSTGVGRANAKVVLFNLDDDSLYALRLSDHSLGVGFPFAGSGLCVAEDDAGNVYVAERNGYKIFRVRL